jgi:hypothetical protein
VISSLILFFLGFIYSYYFYKDSQKNYEITVFADNSFEKENIKYCYVWNSGKTTIYKEDLLNESGCLEISFEDGYYVEYAEISDKTSDYFKTSISQNYENIKIEIDLLRPDEGFTLMLKSIRKSNSYWHLQIKQKRDLIHFPKIIKARGFNSNLYLLNNLFSFGGLLVMAGTSLLLGKIDFLNLNGWYEYYVALLTLLMTGLVIYFTPVLFGRIRAPRPPKELKLHYLEKNLGKGKR